MTSVRRPEHDAIEALKLDIARVVQMFRFTDNPGPGGSCVARAVIGQAVLTTCGLPARLVTGGMLYRAGKHRRRDTLRFCLPNNLGGYLRLPTGDGVLVGHAWTEIGNDIADFSCRDWEAEAAELYETETDPTERALGPVEWSAPPPKFIWQSAQSLKSVWRRTGQPEVGGIWYGGWWDGQKAPDHACSNVIVDKAMATISEQVGALRLRERVAGLSP